jgi:hypothetical protein
MFPIVIPKIAKARINHIKVTIHVDTWTESSSNRRWVVGRVGGIEAWKQIK